MGFSEGSFQSEKHGIDFADAVTILFDDMAISIADNAPG
jgi:uncharacterized DUF497 family protein